MFSVQTQKSKVITTEELELINVCAWKKLCKGQIDYLQLLVKIAANLFSAYINQLIASALM